MAKKDATAVDGLVVAEGEVTGHAHRVVAPSGAQLWRDAVGQTYITPKRSGERLFLDHEEHTKTPLPEAPVVRTTIKRAYSAERGWTRVVD